MSLSCCFISGPRADEVTPEGGVAQWVLANNGTEAWPAATTLRLVGGPVLASPVVEVPPASPGQTVILELQAVAPRPDSADVVEAFYALVTVEGHPFGELLTLRVQGQKAAVPPPSPPVCAVLVAPADNMPSGIEALQGETKTAEWTLANLGSVDWPDDAVARLIYNTPSFAHLPGEIALPVAKPGMTLVVGVTVLMPECEGRYKAMWAVTSSSVPDFGDILFVEFAVDDFPFMDWMLAEESKADTISETTQEEPQEQPEAEKLSAAFAAINHMVPGGVEVDYDDMLPVAGIDSQVSLGAVSGLVPGSRWLLELAVTNDGTLAWPADAELVCCFGDGLGCARAPLVAQASSEVTVGSTALATLELTAPEVPGVYAWVVATCGGAGCFGPVFVLQVK
ncbi:unnamed protein product [Polarella glacialis]|uniref:Nbr1 FW domain-containing protein n=1 Tax=Polarella glacialis TaxID=89957 RepID=A0A813KN21_POLGL|nr:unnamed protein product [Polarella glacialis]